MVTTLLLYFLQRMPDQEHIFSELSVIQLDIFSIGSNVMTFRNDKRAWGSLFLWMSIDDKLKWGSSGMRSESEWRWSEVNPGGMGSVGKEASMHRSNNIKRIRKALWSMFPDWIWGCFTAVELSIYTHHGPVFIWSRYQHQVSFPRLMGSID